MRRVCCPYVDGNCQQCLVGWRCVYGYLFESLRPPHATVMRKYRNVPHPFVFHIADTGPAEVAPGQRLTIGLTLIGRAVAFFPYMLIAMMRLGELGIGRDRLRFKVCKVEDFTGCAVYVDGQKRAVSLPPSQRVDTPVASGGCGEVALHFVTPLRIRSEGQVLRRFDFCALASAMLRRLELLIRLHDPDGIFDLDVQGVLAAAEAAEVVEADLWWQDLKRWSRRQQREMPLGGLRGSLRLRTDMGVFGGLLRLAEIVHVGRGTAFGLGQIRIEGAES